MRSDNSGIYFGRISFATLLAVGLYSAYARADVRVLALTGQPAPGTNAVFAGAPGVSLNDHGDAAISNLLHDGVTSDVDNRGIWTDVHSGGLQLVAHVGDHVPGKPTGVLFDSICCGGQINEAGQVAFQGSMTRGVGGITFENSRALWVGAPNNVRLVAQTSDVAVGTGAPRTFTSFSSPGLNNLGQVVWYSQLEPGTNNGIWSEGRGSLHSLASTIQAPTLEPGAIPFEVIDHVSFNDAGESFFYVLYRVDPGALDEKYAEGLWLDRASGFQLVAASGQVAPGLRTAAVFSSLSGISDMNNAGQVVFAGQLQVGVGGVTATNNQGIWAGPAGNLKVIARSGEVAPGIPGSTVFSSVSGDPVINHSGQVLFSGQTATSPDLPAVSNPFSIWKYDGNDLKVVAREGGQAAGAADGTVFKQFDLMSMNAAGQAIFRGVVGPRDASAPQDSWAGLWAQDVMGALHLIVRNGSQIDVDNGPGVDLRTVDLYSYGGQSGGEDGRYRAFNSLGQIGFTAIFTDNTSAAVITNVVAVPEPATVLLAASVLLFSIDRRRPGAGSSFVSLRTVAVNWPRWWS